MIIRIGSLLSCLFPMMAPPQAGAVEVAGTARIIDGDTLVIGDTIIRLHGIDAAETGQRCIGDSHKILRPGKDTIQLLQSLVEGGVSCVGSQENGQQDQPAQELCLPLPAAHLCIAPSPFEHPAYCGRASVRPPQH